jgi:hypothetical protein
MSPSLPAWSTDWKVAFFAAERRLSPRLEALVRTDAFLDALTVTNSLSRLAARFVQGAKTTVVSSIGLPSSRQIAELQRSLDALAEEQRLQRQLDQRHNGAPS